MANKIIINYDEIAHHLAWITLRRYFSQGPKSWPNINKFLYQYHLPNSRFRDGTTDNPARIDKCIRKDVQLWIDRIKFLKSRFQKLSKLIEDNLPILAKKIGKGDADLGRRILFNFVRKGISPGFAKTFAPKLLPRAEFAYPEDYADADDLFIRNIINNEEIIQHRMRTHKPFWFVDSGYTNFIHGGNKRFHRVTRNDLHHGDNPSIFPADRLGKFETFPNRWRTGGDKILVIEPSKYICRLHGIDITAWRKQINEELSKYTDKEIVYREKQGTRKTRGSLYHDLMRDKSIYCVIHYNSNAGTEAIWAGVPVITLGKHITQSVSRHKLEDINDLYRGPLGNWLCQLSYSQFEFGELMNGVAHKIIRKYHNV